MVQIILGFREFRMYISRSGLRFYPSVFYFQTLNTNSYLGVISLTLFRTYGARRVVDGNGCRLKGLHGVSLLYGTITF